MSTLFEAKAEYSTRVYQINRNRAYRSRASVDIIPIRFHGYKAYAFASVDIIPIRFHGYKAYANYNPEMHEYDPVEGPILVRRETLKLQFSREWASGDEKTTMKRFARYKRVIARSPREANKLRNKLGRYLYTSMGLDEDKHLSIVEQIMEMLQSAVPDKGIKVQIIHETSSSLQSKATFFLSGFSGVSTLFGFSMLNDGS